MNVGSRRASQQRREAASDALRAPTKARRGARRGVRSGARGRKAYSRGASQAAEAAAARKAKRDAARKAAADAKKELDKARRRAIMLKVSQLARQQREERQQRKKEWQAARKATADAAANASFAGALAESKASAALKAASEAEKKRGAEGTVLQLRTFGNADIANNVVNGGMMKAGRYAYAWMPNHQVTTTWHCVDAHVIPPYAGLCDFVLCSDSNTKPKAEAVITKGSGDATEDRKLLFDPDPENNKKVKCHELGKGQFYVPPGVKRISVWNPSVGGKTINMTFKSGSPTTLRDIYWGNFLFSDKPTRAEYKDILFAPWS